VKDHANVMCVTWNLLSVTILNSHKLLKLTHTWYCDDVHYTL